MWVPLFLVVLPLHYLVLLVCLPAIDIHIGIDIEWSGITYGLNEYNTTEPVLNSSSEVPTFTSTARLNAPGTFYDSGDYYCSVVINPLIHRNLIQSTSAVDSPRISGALY